MARGYTEIELKLLADAGLLDEIWRRPSLGSWQVVGRDQELQRNVYYDTQSGELRAEGASLRWRRRIGQPLGELTLKTGRERRGSIYRRQELTVELPAQVDPLIDAAQTEPFALARHLSGPGLRPNLTLETDRRTMELERGASHVELALDAVTIPGTSFEEYEIEAELKHGGRADLEELKAILLQTGRAWPTEHGKRGRALEYLAGHQSQSSSWTPSPRISLSATPSATAIAR